jgi:hypothetical protein
MADEGGRARRHLLLPQETAYRRWAAHMLAKRTGPNAQRRMFETMYGPDGVVYFEAAAGDMIAAAVAVLAGAVVAAAALPYQVATWLFFAAALLGLLALMRYRQAFKAGKAFRGGVSLRRFLRSRQQGPGTH